MSDVSLREFIEAKLEWLDRHVEQRIASMDHAARIALDTLNERLKGMNEFRDSLNDLTGRLATKAELRQLDERLKLLELRDARIAGMAAVVAVIVSATVAIVARFV